MKCEHCKDTTCSERKTAGECTRYGTTNIEIPFGAFDSELVGFEYAIPEGFEAEIKDGKVIVRKAESEDERIRKDIIEYFKGKRTDDGVQPMLESWIAWLEKQGEQKYWTEDEIEPIISDYLCGREHYDGMIGRLRCLKPKQNAAITAVKALEQQKPLPLWKPSEIQIVALRRCLNGNLYDTDHLSSLYYDLIALT